MKIHILLVIPVAIFVGCAKGRTTGSGTGSALSQAIGDWGVSAPTAQITSSSFAIQDELAFRVSKTFDIPVQNEASSTTLPTFASLKKGIDTIMANTSASSCVQSGFSFAQTLPTITCHGPMLTYQNNPDAADGAACTGSTYPCYPLESAGIWSATETTGEACASAKVNYTVKSMADVINTSINTAAGFLCATGLAGGTYPNQGSTLDLKSVVNQAVSGASFSTASLTTLSPRANAYATYETKLDGTVSSKKVYIDMIHSPTKSDNSEYAGHMNGIIDFGAGVMAYSLIYSYTAAAGLSVVVRAGMMKDKGDVAFDTNNNIDYTQTTFATNPVYYHLFNVVPSTGAGTAYTSYMTTAADSDARVFQVTTTSGTPDTGVAYFGYGAALTATSGLGLITKFICNWGGPGASHTGTAAKAESQTLSRNSSGMYTPGTSHITYEPLNACNYGGGTFNLGIYPAAPTNVASTNNNLDGFNSSTGVGTPGNITLISEPTY